MTNYKRIPDGYTELKDSVMSNFTKAIDRAVAEQLKIGKHFSHYPGWDFAGYVWYDKERLKWLCEVWIYHRYIKTFEADTLENIMQDVSDVFGHD